MNTKNKKLHRNRGVSMIITTIIVLATTLVIALSILYIGVGELVLSSSERQSEVAFEAAQSCVNDALLKIRDNTAFIGTYNLTVDVSTCVVTISGSGTTRTISSQGTSGQSVRKLLVTVSISSGAPLITGWNEDIS